VAIGVGGTAHREAARLTGDAAEGERALGPLGLRKAEAKKKLNSDYHVGERRDAEYWIALY
jgi:hypothetical protein